ncbi:MFS transporter [Neobacillus drentensis]|uniref:MFS transporter n=1 Tax=Neobacillus drentensis TaxID=220684 RepID=UPI0028665F88|nr:MFS transporter [Neobacillus drentensis]MDR7240184.1 sugar phosphate permease [Neobacillus drentensis]
MNNSVENNSFWTKTNIIRLCTFLLVSGTIYKIAFMADVFYDQMQEFMGLSNTQIGLLDTVNSFVAMFGFLIGGVLADKVKIRVLVPLGLFLNAVMGIWLAMNPPFWGMIVIFSALAIGADCLVWSALLKAVGKLGGNQDQGKAFGFFEGGRGVVDTVVAFGALGIYVAVGESMKGLSYSILFYSMIDLVLAVAMIFILKDVSVTKTDESDNSYSWSNIKNVLRKKEVWLVAFNVFMVYFVYKGLKYFNPFLANEFHVPAVIASAYGIINAYFLKFVGGPSGGLIVDKLKNPAKYIKLCFAILIALLGVIVWFTFVMPPVMVMVVLLLVFSTVIYSMRGTFWSPMGMIGLKENETGTAFGIGSFIGYAPGVFASILFGAILDNFEGMVGFRIIFISLAVMSVVGFGVALTLQKRISKINNI